MNTYIPRTYDNLASRMTNGRVTVLHGPRRIGKTTLVRNYLKTQDGPVLQVTGDDVFARNILSSQHLETILDWASGYQTLFIDEAQRIPHIGWALKLLIDHRPDLTIIATGSSSFSLMGQLGEPLTGRQVPLMMFPLSVEELSHQYTNNFELKNSLESLLIYGSYPEVVTADSTEMKREKLYELVSSYLYKDILELDKIKNSKIMNDLLALIALQVGNEVSLNELSRTLEIDKNTIARYLDIFEKCFILYNLRGFSRNLRSEVTRTSKYYFYDNGVRNAIINNFNPLDRRNDVGALWENFLVMERLKHRTYAPIHARDYFWRTWEQKEIDLIEDRDGALYAYEFKWSERKKTTAPKQFIDTYPDAEFTVITPDNFLEFVTTPKETS